jgi:hypothetical protein
MSSSSPVPDFRSPNLGVAYQLLVHACPSPPLMIPAARFGWSPSDVPPGPSAAADAIVSNRAAGALETGLGETEAAGAAVADATASGLGADWATAAAGAGERPTDRATVKIRSPRPSTTTSATRATRPLDHRRSGRAGPAGSPAGLAFQ